MSPGRRIALLRGINVGGRNTVSMAELRRVLADTGCRRVLTYIQSGNAVFDHDESDAKVLASRIASAVAERHGFEPEVLVLTGEELAAASAGNPFPDAEDDPSKLHLFFLAAPADDADLRKIEDLRAASERFVLEDSVAYLHAPDGIARSKLAAGLERALGVPATGRNWRTVCKLLELADRPG